MYSEFLCECSWKAVIWNTEKGDERIILNWFLGKCVQRCKLILTGSTWCLMTDFTRILAGSNSGLILPEVVWNRGSYSFDCEEYYLMRYSGRSSQTFRRNLLFDPEDGGRKFLQKFCTLISDYRHHIRSRDSSVVIATGWSARVRFPVGKDIFFSTAPTLALGHTQPPIQWVPGALLHGVKLPGRDADPSASNAVVKNCGAIPPLPILVYGVVLS
jgi:hypothetical protein